jgi:hypothetical protein
MLTYGQSLTDKPLRDPAASMVGRSCDRGETHTFCSAGNGHRAEGEVTYDLGLLYCNERNEKALGRTQSINQVSLGRSGKGSFMQLVDCCRIAALFGPYDCHWKSLFSNAVSLQDANNAQHGLVHQGGDAETVAQLDHLSRKYFDLGLSACLNILEHRCLPLGRQSL